MSVISTTAKVSVIDAALRYAFLSLRVFPVHGLINGLCTCGKTCDKPGKHPATAHGHNDATTNSEQITAWWRQSPWQSIGIAAGDGFWVLDIDIGKGGKESLVLWNQVYGGLPSSPRVKTGSGGDHYYFRLPQGVRVKSRAGVVPGIDTRGEGGYVIAPPSVHACGNQYEWLTPLDHGLVEAPAWLLELVSEKPKQRSTAATGGGFVFTMGVEEANDLASHPGEGEGRRNATLCRLLGVHLSRADSPATLEALALAWAQRCDPPIEEADVRRTIRWAESKRQEPDKERGDWVPADVFGIKEVGRIEDGGKEGIKHDGIEEDTSFRHDSHLDGVGQSSLQADAFHGIAGAIVKAVAPETEADPAGILLTLLTCVGNAIGKGPRFCVGPGSHPPALFLCLAGDTASGKGQAMSIARSLMSRVDPDWAIHNIGYGLSSGEGLVERVSDDPVDGADAFTMPSVKRFLCIEEEFAKPVTAMRREGNTLSPILRTAWDGQTLEVLTRKTKLKASNAHIGIIAHITTEELTKVLGNSVEVANGFANRFLWCHVKRSKLLPFGGNASVLDHFVMPLREAINDAREIGVVKRDAEADELWESVYASLTEAKPGAFGMATQRGRAQVMRLAMLYALLDSSEIIRVEHLRAALAVWSYCEWSARLCFEPDAQVQVAPKKVKTGGEEPLAVRILNAIVVKPGIKRSELVRAFRQGTGDDISEALSWLRAQGLAYPGECKTLGRPAECWYPGGDETSDDDEDESQESPEGSLDFTMGTEALIQSNSLMMKTKGPGFGPVPGIVSSGVPHAGVAGGKEGSKPGESEPVSKLPSIHPNNESRLASLPLSIQPAHDSATQPANSGIESQRAPSIKPSSEDVPEATPEPSHEQRFYEKALKTGAITVDAAEAPWLLTPGQRSHVEWARAYARSQADRIAREEASRAAQEPGMSHEEFFEVLRKSAKTVKESDSSCQGGDEKDFLDYLMKIHIS